MAIPSTWASISGLADDVILDLGDNGLTWAQASGLIVKSVKRLNRRLRLSGTSSKMTIHSSGYVKNVSNNTIEDFLVMQAECLAVKRGYSEAVSKGIRIRSGQDEVDTTSGFRGYIDVVNSICQELTDAIRDYLRDTYGDDALLDASGKLIWYGTQRRREDYTKDGDKRGTRYYDSPFDEDYNGTYSD